LGKDAIVLRYDSFFKAGVNHIEINIGQLTQLGSDVAVGWGNYHVTGQGKSGSIKDDGDWSATFVRDEGAWKIRLLNAFPGPAPPK
jgi:hypothetical protein